jgi:hypothetical protein
MKINKTLSFEKVDVKTWEDFFLENFRTKRVLSIIISEEMEEYIKNFKKY